MPSDADIVRCAAPWPGTAARLLEGLASLGSGTWPLEQICRASTSGTDPGYASQVLAGLATTGLCAAIRGRLREFLMLQAYVDASGKGDPRFLVIAGYIATSDTWAEFSIEWKCRLDHAGLPYFKMNQMCRDPVLAGWFYRVIEEFDIKAAIACVINTEELVQVEKSIIYPPHIINPTYYNPYYLGFRYITGLLAGWQHKLNLLEPIDFIFDDDSEKVKIPVCWELMKSTAMPEISCMMGDTPIFRDDKKTMPLQAADLYAWWAFKWQREGIEGWAKNLPFPWEKKKDIQRIAAYFGRKSFLSDTSKMLEEQARTPEERQYAQSLMPGEWEVPNHF
jgi:hypothetical protein